MSLKIFSGSSHPTFAAQIAERLGLPVGKATNIVFSSGDRFITIDESVRGDDVFVVQTSVNPVDSHIVELLMFIRTLRDASAEKITAVIPYFPYVRSDKRDQTRVCITARLIADLLESAGADRVLTMELHSPQIQGFFSVPCDHVNSAHTIIKHLKQYDLSNYVLVAGDAGAAKLLREYADTLRLPVAIMDKRRDGNDEKPTIKGIIGSVTGKKTLLIDDEVSTGRTLIKDAEYLLAQGGATAVEACITHAVLAGNAVADLNSSPISRFIITNTVDSTNKSLKNKTVVDVTETFAECIRRIHEHRSLESLKDALQS